MNQEWIPVGELGDAFMPDNNCLPAVSDLAGQDLVLHFENGWRISHRFHDDGTLTWSILSGDASGSSGTESYVATRPRQGVYFVDFIKHAAPAESVSLVLDIEGGVFLSILGRLPTKEECSITPLQRIARKLPLTGVDAVFLRGTIGQACRPDARLPQVTDELIGKRVEYRYSANELYEHIYLNRASYTWHCLEGSEQGLCDSDACHYYKIQDDLYLFVWREKIIPTLGVVCIDLRSMKTTGKLFGYETDATGQTRNFGVGAFARIISVVTR